MCKRRLFPANFKARVALAALREDKPVQQTETQQGLVSGSERGGTV